MDLEIFVFVLLEFLAIFILVVTYQNLHWVLLNVVVPMVIVTALIRNRIGLLRYFQARWDYCRTLRFSDLHKIVNWLVVLCQNMIQQIFLLALRLSHSKQYIPNFLRQIKSLLTAIIRDFLIHKVASPVLAGLFYPILVPVSIVYCWLREDGIGRLHQNVSLETLLVVEALKASRVVKFMVLALAAAAAAGVCADAWYSTAGKIQKEGVVV